MLELLLKHDVITISFSTLGAGLLTVIISYSSSIAIVLQAAHAAGADSAQLHSWM
ncbi:MAG: hypothetical protein GX332_05565 [Alcaligenaceae bacterium]|nr:hypothetical protein [Alcaligenaceae bacterium]